MPPKPSCIAPPAPREIHGPLTSRRVPYASPLLIRSRMLRIGCNGAPRSIVVVTPAIRSCRAAMGMISVRKRGMYVLSQCS